MIVYFADKKMNILGMASTGLRGGMVIRNDNMVDDVDTGAKTFDFDLCYAERKRNEAEAFAMPGNYILRKGSRNDEFYIITDSETDAEKHVVTVYSEEGGMALLNAIAGPYAAEEAHPLEYYVNIFAGGSGFTVRHNEVASFSRKLSWDGEATVLARIVSVATQFEAELAFSFEIDKLQVTHQYIDIYRKRGGDFHREIRVGREANSVRIKRSIADLATGIVPSGGIPEGEEDPITLAGMEYDDGDIYLSGGKLLSRSALEKWSRHQWITEPEQQTGTSRIPDGIYKIRTALGNNMVLDLYQASIANEGNICIYEDNGTRAQQFSVIYNRATDTYTITNVYSGKVAEVAWGAGAEGTNVQQYADNGSPQQQWILKEHGTGVYSIHSALNDKAMYVNGGASSRTNVAVCTYTGAAYQHWSFVQVGVAEIESGHILKTANFETTSKSRLLTESITRLKKIRDMAVNYEVDLAKKIDDLQTGEMVSLVDDEAELYLSARVLQISECCADETQKVVLGDYLIRESGISSQIEQLAEDYQSILRRHTLYTWIVYADDDTGSGITTDPDGKRYMGTAANRITATPDLSDPSVYTWVRAVGEDGTAGEDAVVLRIDSSRGVLFKSNHFDTVLTVTIQKGAASITDAAAMRSVFGASAYLQWYWRKFEDEDWRVMSISDSHITEDGFKLTITPDDVDEKIVFKCDLEA